MSVSRVARFVGIAVTSVVLVVSGAYVLIDLARWEWNRAVSSAMFFLAALVVMATAVVLRSVRRVEARLDELEVGRAGGAAPLHRTSDVDPVTSPAGPGRHFDWLRRPPDRLGVFIPVLLGAGVVLSVVAYAVERIAAAVSTPAIDHRTAARLGGELRLGDGSLVDGGSSGAMPVRRPPRRGVGIAVAVVALIAAGAAVQLLRGLTQTRPDSVVAPGRTELVITVEQRRNIRPVTDVVDDLWGACRSRVPGDMPVLRREVVDAATVEMEVGAALGRTGRARIVGCIQDHTIDLVRADVLRVEVTPDPTPVLVERGEP